MGFHWKSWFWEGVHEKSIYKGELPEKEGVIQKQVKLYKSKEIKV